MTRISDLTTKATPVWADLVTWFDSEDANIDTQNKNFLLSGIWSAIFWSRTSTDIPEGTNLFYTEDRVNSNVTVAGKADISNVIEKDSTVAFTPTLDTHPVNKLYADTNTIADATDAIKGKIRISTDTESDTWTDELIAVNPKQLKDRQFTTTEWQIILRGQNSATAIIVYPHSLWVTPKSIRFDMFKWTNVTCHWVYDWINNSLVMPNASTTNITSITHSIRSGWWSSHQLWAVTAVTASDYSITWTAISSPSAWNIAVLATLSI